MSIGLDLVEPAVGRRARAATWLLFMMAVLSMSASGVTLKPETVAVWDEYVQAADASLHREVPSDSAFLLTLADPQHASQVRNGAIVIAAAPGQNPRKVPGGLIHHWTGAMFMPNVTIDDVVGVTRNYDRYNEFYRPSVIDSKTILSNDAVDRFSMVVMNKALFLKTAIDADYEATQVRIDSHRMYIISKTTRLQQIDKYGRPDEHRLQEGEGGGYIWKIHSISRLKESDGGVYVELEAIALSRDIPVAFRPVANPIVRRVSRDAVLVSLQQTERAVRETTTVVKGSVGRESKTGAMVGGESSRNLSEFGRRGYQERKASEQR